MMQYSALKTFITLGFALMASVYTFNSFAAEPQKIGERKVASIDELLVGLRKRLDAQPNDVNGWVLLAKSYHHLDMWHEAEVAAAKARELGYQGDIIPAATKAVNPHANNPHHGYLNPNAGSYVSSFFEQEENQPTTSTKPNTTAQPATQEQ